MNPLERIEGAKAELRGLIGKVLSGEVSPAEANRRVKSYRAELRILEPQARRVPSHSAPEQTEGAARE